MRYYTKEKLYKMVDSIRGLAGLPNGDYPINVIDFCSGRTDYEVGFHPYKTRGLRGTLVMDPEVNTILLNSKQTSSEQNFFCAHELVHSILHRNEGISIFRCFERVLPQQNPYLEWQANEGAAQFLVPYQDFIPIFTTLLSFSGPSTGVYVPSVLADRYGVTTRVIELRIKNLSYEIDQYKRGVPIGQIELLSNKRQRDRGIISTDYTAACDFGFSWDAEIG